MNDDPKPEIEEAPGANIRKLRESRRWDMPELARKSGVSEAVIARVENNRYWHSVSLKAIAAAFGVSVPELFLSDEDMELLSLLSTASQEKRRECIRLLYLLKNCRENKAKRDRLLLKYYGYVED